MKKLSKVKFCGFLAITALVVMLAAGMSAANITGGSPGYPGDWEGMTTNTIIKIDLDRAVAMSDGQPDMTYVVKKASFDGFDFVPVNVQCDVEVSDDRKTIRIYPQVLLDEGAFYAYKLEHIAFADGTQQAYTQCYATGTSSPQLLNSFVSEVDMCEDSASDLSWSSWCARCHVEWASFFPCAQTAE